MTRLILGACILAQVAQAQSVAKPALAMHTTEHETEIGSWRDGDAVVWVRVAPTGAISVFASHGYRSAFAHAIIITPEDADKWAEIGEHMLAGQAQPPGAVMLADSDLALEATHAGDSTVLAVRLGGVRPDGITFLMNGQSLHEVTPILRATAKQSRSTQAAAAAPPPPPATHNVAAVDTQPAPAPEAEVAPVTPAVSTVVSATPAVVASPTAMPVVPQTPIMKVTKPKPAPAPVVSASLRGTSAGTIAKPAAAPLRADEPTDATKLSATTVANLVKQWQSQLDLCYSEFGLKVNPSLTGSIAVRLAIRPTGDVGAATLVRHKWSGAGGNEAESCMRARVMAWMFPPTSAPSTHDFTVAFAP
ncbi:MAG TPA: AgmX/PglI C-terminal domain-containing protein [Gemmatimonadaceae bacterium]|nr:AgmX/PglI C-terminal domain-containing protein [Gemmatimonadaceae bacterium]